MKEMQSTVGRMEARIDYQAARIDALYAILHAQGVLPCPPDAGRGGALFEELDDVEDAPLARDTQAWTSRRPPCRLRVGEATGV
jgi:hypothetical protein